MKSSKENNYSRYLPVLALFLLMILLIYSTVLSAPKKPEPLPIIKECSGNESRICSVGPCNGTQICENGKWLSCTWEVICEPGSKAPCDSSNCACNYKECNICGSGYGECNESCKVG